MRVLLITGADTGVGKTRVTGALARLLVRTGRSVQIVKPVETGRTTSGGGDAEVACRLAGPGATGHTLASFMAPLAPVAAARAEGGELDFDELVARTTDLPEVDWRLVEGAGGIATPVSPDGRDWADFAAAIGADGVVVVVDDRLGAINRARLALARARAGGRCAGVWLNACAAPDGAVGRANRDGLDECGVPLWGELGFGALVLDAPEAVLVLLEGLGEQTPDAAPEDPVERWRKALAERKRRGLRRRLETGPDGEDGILNLKDNDYLGLARDPALVAGATAAGTRHGSSASASPLLSGWRRAHAELVAALGAWQGFACGLLWNSGHAANSGVLGTLAQPGDVVLADKLVHQSMLAGIARSGARLRRYDHLRLDHLESLLGREKPGGAVFVATESVFSMDGDCTDLVRLMELKRRFGFFLVLDEAHALGWYGPEGAGLAGAAGLAGEVDVLVGTFGKALGAGGAYTLFRDEIVRDQLVNFAGEFVFSTAVSPLLVGAAQAGLGRLRVFPEAERARWRERSASFRRRLRAAGWDAPGGDSPIVPVRLGTPEAAVELADALHARGIMAAAVRPPTVPAGTSRLRFSLRRTFDEAASERVVAALGDWRTGR